MTEVAVRPHVLLLGILFLLVSCGSGASRGSAAITSASFTIDPLQAATNAAAPVAFTVENTLPVSDAVGGETGVIRIGPTSGCTTFEADSGSQFLFVFRPQLFRWNATTERLEYGTYEDPRGSTTFNATHSFASGDRAKYGGQFLYDPSRHTLDRTLECGADLPIMIISQLLSSS